MKQFSFVLLILLSSLTAIGQSTELHFAMDPVLTPDGSHIIFSYESDLWRVPSTGGEAVRLTAMDGMETRPSVSPDGKWLAFSGSQSGNMDIYVMPLAGGEIQQLTFHDASDDVDSWSWDSEKIYFTSDRLNRMAGYSVDRSGGTPVRLFEHYFNTVHNVVEHPSSGELFFNESWESKRFANRKRYKGDYNPDIKSYNRETGEYKEYTSYNGKDFGVTIDRNGNTYFMSDEGTGEYNIFTFRDGEKTALTSFDTSVFWPKVNANGGKIVFRKDYQLHILDVATGQTTKPAIRINRNSIIDKPIEHDVKGNITDFDVSPDNKKLAFVSRGELFVSDVKGKFVRRIDLLAREAAGEVWWLKDNRTLLFTLSDGGYYNIYTISADGSGGMKKHTNDEQTNRSLSVDPERKRMAYLSGRNEVRIMDLSTMESKTVANDELWGFRNAAPQFSPDGKYLAFNAFRNFETDVFIYDIGAGKTMNLTNTRVSENGPVWTPDGKYLVISTDPLNPSYPYGADDANIYRIPLQKLADPFKMDKVDELFAPEDSPETAETSKGKKSAKKDDGKEAKEESNPIVVRINPENIMERMEVVGPSFGQQVSPYAMAEGDKTFIFFISNHDEGTPSLYVTTYEPFEKVKTEKLLSGRSSGFLLREAGGKYYLLTGNKLYTVKPAEAKAEEIELSYSFQKQLNDEFVQMFYEAWAGVEENFYDEDFHGEDWQALRDRYAQLLPYISSRYELRLIFNDMLGELNTSHYGFSSSGDEEKTYLDFNTVGAGILFDEANPYQVTRIIKDGPADLDDAAIRPGDKLVAVNGQTVDPAKNREFYFYLPSRSEEVELTFERDGKRVSQKIHPISSSGMSNLLYDEWQDANQAYVDDKGQGRIAYVHMKNMGRGEYNSFAMDMVREGAYKDALILDLRYNTGGNVHDDVLNFLSRREYLKWKYREGELASQPNFHPADKPIVLLINEQSLSDAEMTAAGFKALGLGTIVGTETYRWIIFTSGKGLVDGSFYRLPAWGCYTLDGKDLEKTGVQPDVRADEDFSDRLNNRNPQLDKAIEIILQQLDE